jgi:NTE family protein
MSKALVLSGGGSVGIAWQTGLAAGLARGGVFLADADFILGTSAGSAVGAQLALGRDLEEQVARYGSTRERVAAEPAAGSLAPTADRMAKLMEFLASAREGISSDDSRRAVGQFALEAETMPEDRFVEVFRYLAGAEWPEAFSCTAVHAETGEPIVWNALSGVALDRAVASSCAVPGLFPPITLNGRRCMDGGIRSASNADLAAGHDRVLLVTLIGRDRAAVAGQEARFASMRELADREIETIRTAGGTVEVLGPDIASADVMGMNLMDPSVGPVAAAAGVRQGEQLVASIAEFWA